MVCQSHPLFWSFDCKRPHCIAHCLLIPFCKELGLHISLTTVYTCLRVTMDNCHWIWCSTKENDWRIWRLWVYGPERRELWHRTKPQRASSFKCSTSWCDGWQDKRVVSGQCKERYRTFRVLFWCWMMFWCWVMSIHMLSSDDDENMLAISHALPRCHYNCRCLSWIIILSPC